MGYARLVPVLLILAWVSACSRGPTRSAEESQEPLKKYPMRGSVIRVDQVGHLATIKSQKIEGWMEAMTMDYPVKDPADLAKLRAGDAIQATVFVQGLNYWVGDVRPGDLGPGDPASVAPTAPGSVPPAPVPPAAK
jgi:Cu/Ag efflux protein CusF